jgi:hypothetical protein
MDELHNFIIRAKAATYVGDGAHAKSCRLNSHDLEYRDGDYAYLDSYFGGTDFIGEEVVYCKNQPVWAENYYGRILEPQLITAVEAGKMIKVALSAMYAENRFLGAFQFTKDALIYFDTNEGDFQHFRGLEWIEKNNIRVYELFYHGGRILD